MTDNTTTPAGRSARPPRAAKAPPRRRRGRWAGGFTLVELLVVIGVIVLVLALTLPSMISLFNAGADAQSANIVAAQLMAARNLAIQNGTYVGLHVQLGNPTYRLGGQCWLAVVQLLNRTNYQFGQVAGYPPVRLPGGMALGELSDRSVSGPSYNQAGVSNENDFTTFTVVFSPSGKVVTQVEGHDISFNTNTDVLFKADANVGVWAKLNVNDDTNANGKPGEAAATAMTLFDYGRYKALDAAGKRDLLEATGQFLPVNVHTGQLFPRK